MANVSPSPKLQFLDSAGNPLVGGKLYTYAAGTTTPLATYTDAGGLTSNANPVILDSRGEANVWLGTSQYKFKLTTSADVELWTVDNLNAADAVTLNALAASTGSSLVGFVQSGAGAVATTAQAKLRETVSVKDFGAKGDETSDDTASINAANTYAASRTYGGTVYFPNGRYRTTSAINVPANVSWEAESPGWYYDASHTSGVLICPQHSGNTVNIVTSNNGMGQYFRGIGIRGYGPVYSGGTGHGFNIGPVANVTLNECNVFHVYGNSFVVGDGSASANTNTLFNCYSNNPETGSNFVINSTLFRGDSLRSDGGAYGLDLADASTEFSIGRCHFEGWTLNGIRCAGHQGNFYGHTILACTYSNTLTFVKLTGSANAVVFSGLDLQVASLGVGSIGFDISAGSAITVRDCTIAKCAIGVNDTSTSGYTTIDNNVISGCSKGIYTTQNYTKYINNTFLSNVTYDVEHAGGTGGLWCGNRMSLSGDNAFKPTFSGQTGNFNQNKVRDNSGYVTRNSGVATSIATGSTINHGLVGAPASNGVNSGVVVVYPSTAIHGLTGPVGVSTLTSTTFRVDWTGTTPNSFVWEARMMCDF